MDILIRLLLFLTAVFLIVLVLIQRGKGGGLAGAFGGMGGQSAFGTKAGDLFTKITIGVAAFWIVLCIITVRYFGATRNLIEDDLGGKGQDKGGVSAPPSTESEETGGTAPQPAGPADSGGDDS